MGTEYKRAVSSQTWELYTVSLTNVQEYEITGEIS